MTLHTNMDFYRVKLNYINKTFCEILNAILNAVMNMLLKQLSLPVDKNVALANELSIYYYKQANIIRYCSQIKS